MTLQSRVMVIESSSLGSAAARDQGNCMRMTRCVMWHPCATSVFIYLLLFEIQLHRLVGGDTCENNPPIAYKVRAPICKNTHSDTRRRNTFCCLFTLPRYHPAPAKTNRASERVKDCRGILYAVTFTRPSVALRKCWRPCGFEPFWCQYMIA